MTRLTGRPWFNLSYGGAQLIEIVQLGAYVLSHYRVHEIVWDVPFTRMVGGATDDMPRAIEMARAPLRHAFTYETLHASYPVLRQAWLGVDFNGPKLDTGKVDVVTYQLDRARIEMAGRPWPAAELASLEAVGARALRPGVDVKLLVPPLHARTRAVLPQAFPDRYRRYQALLAGGSVIDLDRPPWIQRWPAEDFVDSVHLRQPYRKSLTEALAGALDGAHQEPGDDKEEPDGPETAASAISLAP